MSHFKSKEHYQQFRAAWSNAVNDPKAKKEVRYSTYKHWRTGEDVKYGYTVSGWIDGEHHLLFNILTDQLFHKGFIPLQSVHKISHGEYINRGLYHAAYRFNNAIGYAQRCLEAQKKQKSFLNRLKKDEEPHAIYWERSLDSFLEPFEGTVTVDMLAKMEKIDIAPLMHWYGDGVKIYEQIKECGPIKYSDIYKE